MPEKSLDGLRRSLAEYCPSLKNPEIKMLEKKAKLILPIFCHFEMRDLQGTSKEIELVDLIDSRNFPILEKDLLSMQKTISDSNRQVEPFHNLTMLPRQVIITKRYEVEMEPATFGCAECNYTGMRSVSKSESAKTYRRMANEDLVICDACSGRGRIRCHSNNCRSGRVICRTCNGTGRSYCNSTFCHFCNGTGYDDCPHCHYGEVDCTVCQAKGRIVKTTYHDVEEQHTINVNKIEKCHCHKNGVYKTTCETVECKVIPILFTAQSQEQFKSKDWSRIIIPTHLQKKVLFEIKYGNRFEWLTQQYDEIVTASGKLIAENVTCYQVRQGSFNWMAYVLSDSSEFVLVKTM